MGPKGEKVGSIVPKGKQLKLIPIDLWLLQIPNSIFKLFWG